MDRKKLFCRERQLLRAHWEPSVFNISNNLSSFSAKQLMPQSKRKNCFLSMSTADWETYWEIAVRQEELSSFSSSSK